MKEKEIDHDYTNEIVCPYCGYEHGDSWEVSDDEGKMDCHSCEKEFKYQRDITIDYSTQKI